MIENNNLTLWGSFKCSFIAVRISLALQKLAWRNAGVIKRCRKKLLSAEVSRLSHGKVRRIWYFCRNPRVLLDLLVSRLLPLRLYYFFRLLPDHRQVKKAVRPRGQYQPESQLDPEKLNRLYKKLLTMPGISQSSGALTTQPALELEASIIDILFREAFVVHLDNDLLKLLSVIERPSVVILLFLCLCGCPNCRFVLSTNHIVALMGYHVANQIHCTGKKRWTDVEEIVREDQDNANAINGTIRGTEETLHRISARRERYDAQMITMSIYLKSYKLLCKDRRLFENPDVYSSTVNTLAVNTRQFTF